MAGPGQAKTGGRKRGTPNKLTVAVKEAILAAFDQVGGTDYLVEVARSDPRVFCTLLGKLVPAAAKLDPEGADLVVSIRDYTSGIATDVERTDA